MANARLKVNIMGLLFMRLCERIAAEFYLLHILNNQRHV
jgi:hypothetical protein